MKCFFRLDNLPQRWKRFGKEMYKMTALGGEFARKTENMLVKMM